MRRLGPPVAFPSLMICFSLRIVVAPSKQRDLLASLGSLLAPTRVQPDCLSARLLVDAGDENSVTLIQEWATRLQLDRYLGSDSGRLLLEAMESSSVAPEVRFDTIRQRDGMKVFAQARSQHG